MDDRVITMSNHLKSGISSADKLVTSFNKQINVEDSGKQKPNSKNNKTKSVSSSPKNSDGEEMYYGGIRPASKKEENVTSNIPVLNNACKRKANKEAIPTDNLKKRKEINNHNDIVINSKIIEEEENLDTTNIISNTNTNTNTNTQQHLPSDLPPKKVKKVRKVKQTSTYMDEKNYLVTKDEFVDEEYWTDEKSKPIQIQPAIITTNNNSKQPAKKNNKKIAPGQSSIQSFFTK
jgi:hypothetical protein